MKFKSLLLATLAASALIGGSLLSNAQIAFTVDPGQNWAGYINAYETPANGGAYATGFVEGDVSTASANWAPGPSQPLTMSPNTRLYDDVLLDPYWVDQGTFIGNKVIEFDYYQEHIDDAQIGQSVSFYFNPIANTLPAGYEAVGFIKVLDAFSSWATTQIVTTPLVAGQPTTLTLAEVLDPGAGTASVQAGFWVKGLAVSSSDPIASTGVQIVPEPTTLALAGLGAAALLIFRRRS